MNCLKSVRFVRDFGSVRLALISVAAVPVFFVLFESINLDLEPDVQLNAFSLPVFLASLLIVYPLHKLSHCLPVWACGKKASLTFEFNTNKLPVLFCNLKGAVSRNLAIACVLFPAILISGICLALAVGVPEDLHYWSAIGSLNFGISVSDLLYIAYLLKAPRRTFVEDERDGFQILVQTYKDPSTTK